MLVPEHGDGDPVRIARVSGDVGLAQKPKSIDWVPAVTRAIAKRPTPLVSNWVDDGDADDVFEPLQFADDECARGPGTGQRDIEVVAVPLNRIRRGAVIGDPSAECVGLTFELTRDSLFIGELGFHSRSIYSAMMLLRRANAIRRRGQRRAICRNGNS